MENQGEVYIPSVHLKNVSPGDWLDSPSGKEFIEKLEEFEIEYHRALKESSEKYNALATPLMNLFSELNKINDEAGE